MTKNKKMKDVIIIGAGIAGLSAGFELQKENIDFQILEPQDRVGGVIETLKIGDYLVEAGPHTFSSYSQELLDLINELGIEEEIQEASPDSKKRYIYLNNHLMPVPASLPEFFKTEIISKKAKWTIFEEIFIEKEAKEESVEDFITRRFGREVLKNLIQPFLNGIFSGDVKKLSATAVFPKLKELENSHKSIILGFLLSRQFLKSKKKLTLYSFKEGMEFLACEIYKKLKAKVTLNANEIEITRAKDCFIVTFKVNNKIFNYPTSSILFATPAYTVLNYSHLFPNQHFAELFHIDYSPISTVTQVIDKSKLSINLDGFGYLCTKEPHRKLLGTVWTSSIFPNRAPSEKALFTSYIGGSHYKKITDQSEDEIKNIVTKEVCETLHISDHHLLETIHIKIHPFAIPQYNIGHLEKVKRVEALIDKNYGLFFTGNYFHGISINDTVKTSKTTVDRIKKFLNTSVKKEEVLITNT